MSLNTCPCGNETKNNYMCSPCIEDSFPAYLADENGNEMTIEEVMANSVVVDEQSSTNDTEASSEASNPSAF